MPNPGNKGTLVFAPTLQMFNKYIADTGIAKEDAVFVKNVRDIGGKTRSFWNVVRLDTPVKMTYAQQSAFLYAMQHFGDAVRWVTA